MTLLHEETGLETTSVPSLAERLAEATPSPGGSTVAALPAAFAAGLVGMVARLTAATDPFGELAFELDAVAHEADELRGELLHLVDEDAAAFDRVVAALRPPRAGEEAVRRAYEAAVAPPLRVCRLSLRVLQLAADMRARGDPHAAADVDVAGLFAAASLDAGARAVERYLLPVESASFRAACREELRAIGAAAAAVR